MKFVVKGSAVDRIAEPQNQRSRDTRAAILDAAWHLLEHAGGSAVTMTAVADEAGISRRGLYLHFATRGQLFSALLDHIDDRLDLASSVRPLLEAPDAVTALDAWARHTATYHARLVPVARAVDRSRDDDPDAESLWQRSMTAWYRGCQALAAAIAAEERLAEGWTVETAADLLWALMSVEFVDDLVTGRSWSVDELASRLSMLVRRTLVAER